MIKRLSYKIDKTHAYTTNKKNKGPHKKSEIKQKKSWDIVY